ncbi:MAG: divergent polysaccharide deacetylase family protein [Marinosulfonomonas sp.]|nr:divergent polysaccharide deacetylase family protein [Marinosulfonomonas sp.]
MPVQTETGTKDAPVMQDTGSQPKEQATAPEVAVASAPTGGEAEQATPVDETAVPKPDTADVTTATPVVPAISDADDAPDEGAEPAAMAIEDAAVTPAGNPALPKAPQTEMQPEAEGQTNAMTAPAMQEAPVAPKEPAPDEGQGAEAAAMPDVEVASLPDTPPPKAPDAPATEQAPVPDAPAEPATPETAPAPAVEPDAARASVPQIQNLAPNVQTNRLPTIGGDADASEAEVAEQQADATDQGALIAYAAAFENPDAKPVMSVILIDDPENPVSDGVLAHLPFALSFAIDAVRDDAHAVAARYRAAGFEVLMLTNLPFGAKASDIEVAFDAYARAIPEAVAVLDQGANGFLRGPSTATQIAGILSDRGFGLITPSKGLNSAQKAAMREGVPAALIFRELDSDGEKPAVIRRYLDRAAFRAAQEGSVIMLGHTRPETIEALVLWALEDRAASVAMAPVSVVLTAQ